MRGGWEAWCWAAVRYEGAGGRRGSFAAVTPPQGHSKDALLGTVHGAGDPRPGGGLGEVTPSTLHTTQAGDRHIPGCCPLCTLFHGLGHSGHLETWVHQVPSPGP